MLITAFKIHITNAAAGTIIRTCTGTIGKHGNDCDTDDYQYYHHDTPIMIIMITTTTNIRILITTTNNMASSTTMPLRRHEQHQQQQHPQQQLGHQSRYSDWGRLSGLVHDV